jgi:hypothetical protein
MLICMFAYTHTVHMKALPAHAGIGEEQVAESQPMVRALIVERLEQVWSACEPFINDRSMKPDPRFLENGLRALDRLMRLYRLDSPGQSGEPDEGSRIDIRELVLAQVRELETRMRMDQGPPE